MSIFFNFGAGLSMIALFLSGLGIPVEAEEAPGARPKIGLVLAGGGARGAAHIGVIKVLERMRVPIDCIAGTSMGAIVGGMYAAGLTVEEMEKALVGIDWVDIFKDLPPRAERSFRRKRDDDTFLVKAKPGLKDGKLALPKGAIQGQKLNLIFKQLTLPVAEIQDFDRLKIPFRAVATDIGTGQPVVLRSGDLATAMRASMSIPGVLAPVTIDGRLLVDGGVANNLPIDVARATCADVVIAVSIGTPLTPADELQSVLGITLQLTTIMTQRNTQQQLASLQSSDILIEPDLGKITTTDFAKAAEAIPIGAKAARAERRELNRLALSPEQYRDYLAAAALPTGAADPVIDFIRVENDSRLSDEVIRSHLHIKPGDSLDLAVLERDLGRIYGLDNFKQVDYALVREKGQTGLVVRAFGKDWGPNYLQFGLNLQTTGSEGTFNIGASYTMTELNALGGEWRSEFTLGTDFRFFSDFYQPLDYDNQYFIAPHILFDSYRFSVSGKSNQRLARYRLKKGEIGLAGGRNLGDWGEFRLGVRWGGSDNSLQTGRPLLPEGSVSDGGYFARLWGDTLDSVNFPRRGWRAGIEYYDSLKALGADNAFRKIEASGFWPYHWGRHTLIPRFRLGGRLSGDLSTDNRFFLGGFLNLSGFQSRDLSGEYTGLGQLIYFYELRGASSAFDTPLYLGGSLEAGNTWERSDDISFESLIPAGSVFLGADTFLGPFYLGAGLAESGRSAFYMFLGVPFQ